MIEPTLEDYDSRQDIIIENDAWRVAPFQADEAEETAKSAIQAALAETKLPSDTGLSVLLTDDAALQNLNNQFRDQDKPTNVLSFPSIESGETPLDGYYGDIAVALETVLAEALEAEISPLHHLAHMVVHGVLHLAGYDHQQDDEAEIMEAMEIQALARIGVPAPYAVNEFAQ